MAKNAIENAEKIIEAFGGIRPMAKKIDVAVTTVQGWKKRNVIPGTRRDLIIQAAAEHDVDLNGLVAAGGANENVSKAATPKVKPKTEVAAKPVNGKADDDVIELSDKSDDIAVNQSGDDDVEAPVAKPVVKKVKTSEEKVIVAEETDSFDQPPVSSNLKFVLVAALLIALGVAAVFAYFWQQSNAQRAAEAARIQQLEEELSAVEQDVQDNQGFLGKIIPQDLNEKLTSLQDQATELQENIGSAAQIAQDKAREVSEDVLAENAGNLEERLTKLETHLQDMTGKPVLAGMLERVQSLQSSEEGSDVLARTVVELNALFETLQLDAAQGTAEEAINQTLDIARDQSSAIGQTFNQVPQEDLKAAAMLLGMAQLRSALNRDNEAFETDLSLLNNMVSEENTELKEALARLAPHAQDGVLTPSGLSGELRTFAGDAVAASLAGEDVTVQERAKARMNELFSVQKDGELITGTDTQASLLKAEQQLQSGDVEAAINAVQALDGQAAAAITPWLEKAQATLKAQDAKQLVNDAINVTSNGGQLISNDALGINIYTPKNGATYGAGE